MRKIFIVVSLVLLLISCKDDKSETIILDNKLDSTELKIVEKSVNYFNYFIESRYPRLSKEDAYKQFVQDFAKDNFKGNVYYTKEIQQLNKELKNQTNLYIKIKDVNKNPESPFVDEEDYVFDSYYPNFYLLNTKSSFFKSIESKSGNRLLRYLELLKKNKDYYSTDFVDYFLLNINQEDYKNSSTKLIIIFNFFYNTSINVNDLNEYNLSKQGLKENNE